MRSRQSLFRRLFPEPPAHRTFAHRTASRLRAQVRPQVPFLVGSHIPHSARFLSTETKAWLKQEVKRGARWIIYVQIVMASTAAIIFALSQERLERLYPTPHEWRYMTRLRFRTAQYERDHSGNREPDWTAVAKSLLEVAARLLHPNFDGKWKECEVRDRLDGVEGKDVSAMPEPWRRGFFEAFLAACKAVEHRDGWVIDMSRGIFFPVEMVQGPSNPFPRPIPPGFSRAPKEEDCKPGFPTAGEMYQKLLAIKGLTEQQVIETRLAYASYLDYKENTEQAREQYEKAVLASARNPEDALLNLQDWTLRTSRAPSETLLKSLTAYATFKAKHEDPATALPIFLSLLMARRLLPSPETSSYALAHARRTQKPIRNAGIFGFFKEPDYPSPPSDGFSPAVRDKRAECEEIALSLYIGEILCSTGRDQEGLGWTREAVDTAEEKMRHMGTVAEDRAARKVCRECLGTALHNWGAMVARLAEEEARRREPGQGSKAAWFGLWVGGKAEDASRWATEKKVVQERSKRVADLLEEFEAPEHGLFEKLFRA